MKTLVLTAAITGLAFAPAPAFANTAPLPTETVSTAGLDLNTAEGQRMLDERIERAAREVCQVNYVRTGSRIRSTSARECVAKARASAQRQMATIAANQRRGG